MVGIVSYGGYVPLFRLNRADIGKAWGGPARGGEKAVANFDEDSVTMAVAAAMDCINGIDRETIDGLYFASTTSPYREKQCAAIVAGALDLRRQIFSGDFSASLRAGTIALKAAVDAVQSGSAKKVLVTASDCRLGVPRSEFEQDFSDGAAALIIGDSDVAVTIEGSYSHTDEFMDLWRSQEDIFVKSWEDRFILMHGYGDNLREAVSGIIKKYNMTPKDFAKAVYYAPDARRHREMVRTLGFSPEQVQDPMFDRLGHTGAAFSLMMLVAALEEAKAGDKILFVSYGDGADAFILQATEQIERSRDRKGVKGHLQSKRMLPNYEKYVSNRELMVGKEAQRRPAMFSYPPVLWRDRHWVLSLHASKCRQCGRLFFPPQRVCLYCQAKDDFEEVRLSDRKGKLFNFCKDNLALSGDPPTILTQVHLDGDVRVYCQMTDRDPDEVEVGMPQEMTFRKMHEAGGYPNYFWKSRPVR